jgi:outer membrane biosynthesis protein TonB
VAGTVRIQVYINEEGEPLTLQLLESVDPDLDGIAMRAMTQMRWRPTYTMRKGRWVAIPAWARLGVPFGEGT